jgi:acetyl-CoA acetyltransferase
VRKHTRLQHQFGGHSFPPRQYGQVDRYRNGCAAWLTYAAGVDALGYRVQPLPAWTDERCKRGNAMPLPAETDATTPKYLRDKYAIVGVGETTYTRGSGKTTRAMGTFAVRAAMLDAGLKPGDIDGMLSYSGNDSTPSPFLAGDLGIRLNFFMDVNGGGSSTEALIGIAIGVIEAGMCKCVAIFRSMNGYSQVRIGGTGARSAAPVNGDALHSRAYGWQSAGQMFAPTFMRHMYEYGTKPEQVAMVKVVHSEHASNNPKAFYKKRYTVEDVINSRMICKPLHLLDCCVETDNATCIIVTRAERARDLKHTPALIRSVVGRCSKPRTDMHYQHGPISRVAGYYAKDILWPNAGVGPEDIDAVGAYDAFTFTSMLQLEDYGFCKKGEGGEYVSSGITRLGGKRPQNTSGGHLCEGYTHGMNMVIENVRQLRHDADDSCPIGPDGKRQHTFDYREGGCRQVRNIEVTANLGWANPMTGSAMVMRRG